MIETLKITWLFLALIGCGKFLLPHDQRSSVNENAADQNLSQKFSDTRLLLADPETRAWIERSFAHVARGPLNDDAVWSLSKCRCANNMTSDLFKLWAETKGVLPQVLTPNIRVEVSENPTLKKLAELPDLIKSIVMFFVNDEKIAEEIRKKIVEKISSVLPGGTTLGEQLKFRFDHFLYPLGASMEYEPRYFSLKDQLSRWNLNFATDGLWLNATPIAFNDHGLQMLSIIQTLSEWQYLFGLNQDSTGRTLGGLTYDLVSGLDSDLNAFDPSALAVTKRFVSGGFLLGYENENSVEVATDLIENWRGAPLNVSLKEQARLWQVAANAVARLRPKNRGHIQMLFSPEKALLPENVHGVSLIILSTMQSLLDGPFIDVEAKLIRDNADLPGTSEVAKAAKDEPAGFGDLIELAEAMVHWAQELKDTSDLAVDGVDLSALDGASETLVRGVKLITQTLLRDYLAFASVEDPGEIANLAESTISDLSHAIVTLIKINREIFSSDYLESKIESLVEIYFNYAIKSRMQSDQPALTLSELFDMAHALNSIRASNVTQSRFPEFTAFADTFDQMLKKWDGD